MTRNGGKPFHDILVGFDRTKGSTRSLEVFQDGEEVEPGWEGIALHYVHINRAPEYNPGFAMLGIAFAPPSAAGSFSEPGNGWLVVHMDAGEIVPGPPDLGPRDVFGPSDSYINDPGLPGTASVYYAGQPDEAPNTGTISLDELDVDPSGRNSGSIAMSVSFDDVSITLPSGDAWTLNGNVSASGSTPPSSSGSGGGGGCTASYEGPNGEPQRDSQCQAAWSAICNDQSPDAFCEIYNSDSWGSAGSCPYC